MTTYEPGTVYHEQHVREALEAVERGVYEPHFQIVLAAELRAVRARAKEMLGMRRVCVESPLRGDIVRNTLYADGCQLDCIRRGEAPFLGHLLYPRVLDDAKPEDRELGIAMHLAYLDASDLVAVYVDLGVTDGMKLAEERADQLGVPLERRQLGHGWMQTIANIRGTKDFFTSP